MRVRGEGRKAEARVYAEQRYQVLAAFAASGHRHPWGAPLALSGRVCPLSDRCCEFWREAFTWALAAEYLERWTMADGQLYRTAAPTAVEEKESPGWDLVDWTVALTIALAAFLVGVALVKGLSL